MKKNSKKTYKLNESFKRKSMKGRIPMFESYLEYKYDSNYKLVDGAVYVVTVDVYSEDGTLLIPAGTSLRYTDMIGTGSNPTGEFVTDSGVMSTADGQQYQPEILMSQDVITTPELAKKENPELIPNAVITECRRIIQSKSRRSKINEELTPEQKAKYEKIHSKLTYDEIIALNKKVDELELKAQELIESGDESEETMKKLDKLTAQSLHAYYKATGGQYPAWHEDYMDDLLNGDANESEDATEAIEASVEEKISTPEEIGEIIKNVTELPNDTVKEIVGDLPKEVSIADVVDTVASVRGVKISDINKIVDEIVDEATAVESVSESRLKAIRNSIKECAMRKYSGKVYEKVIRKHRHKKILESRTKRRTIK